MGQWGVETSAGDSVHDYLQYISVDTSKFRQFDVKPLLDYTWNDIQVTDRDKLGVVMHLLTHELTVPIDKLKEVMEIANNELHPDQLASWNEKAERTAMVVIEMNDIRHALENKGKGRARHAKGLLEKMDDIINEETIAKEKEMAETLDHLEDTLNSGEKTIKLPCYGIVVTLTDKRPSFKIVNTYHVDTTTYGGGSITSDLKEICQHCNDSACLLDCPEWGKFATSQDFDWTQEKRTDKMEWLAFRGAADALESIILAHACAGIDIESPAYIEGIETAQQALTNADYSVETE